MVADQNQSLTKGQRTQLLIIEKALLLLKKLGFANTSMQMIATECGLSQGAVMQHFKSKHRLLEAIRGHVSQSNHKFVDSKIDPTEDGLKALRRHMLLNLEWALRHRAEASIVIMTYEAGIYDEAQREVANSAARLGTERIIRYLYSAKREGLLRPGLDLEILGDNAQSFLLGLILKALSRIETTKIPAQTEKQIKQFLDSFKA